jgi:hypothetical protein
MMMETLLLLLLLLPTSINGARQQFCFRAQLRVSFIGLSNLMMPSKSFGEVRRQKQHRLGHGIPSCF